jgi:hypothetical protein
VPHTTDFARLRACSKLLYIPQRSLPRTPSGRPFLDAGSGAQHTFQALLVSCLMSTRDEPHELEHPTKPALASISGYLNWIAARPNCLEVHTNTAARIASRLLPLLHHRQRVSGIPGLRLLRHNGCRLQLEHLPTDARLDLVDSTTTYTPRDMKMLLKFETAWHHDKDDTEALWTTPQLTEHEAAQERHWTAHPCTALRSALMVRSMPLWYRMDIAPAWVKPLPGSTHDRLTWDADSAAPCDAQAVAELLTQSAVSIPGARYDARTRHRGILSLGDGSIELIADCHGTFATPRSA